MMSQNENIFCFEPVEPPVSFRCMIQDMLGNEIYPKHNSDKFGDRTIFYCISIPGENEWVRNSPKGSKNEFLNNTVNPVMAPRELDNGPSLSVDNGEQGSGDTNKNRISFSLVNYSYPIPSDGKNKSCLIKVYDINLAETLRVNDIVHVTGVVEPVEFEDDSRLIRSKSVPSNGGDSGCQVKIVAGHEDMSFEPACDFPHQLVPRVHIQTLKKLNHFNPLLPEIIIRDQIDLNAVKLAKARLSTIMTQLFGGDSLAAEYFILSLLARIYKRKDVTTLGQLTIGLTGFKPDMKFLIEKTYEIISKITTHSHFIDMSLANLNNLSFTPKKDYDNNKMIAGTLQLPDGLYLVLNETSLNEGQLTVQGTANLKTLGHIVRWQKHKYDFKFNPVEIDTDLKILVLSEGRSILPIPFEVRLEKTDPESIIGMRQACESVDDFLTEDLLNMFRYYITALNDVPSFTITDETHKIIQDDFVNWRKDGENCGKALFSSSDLSSYMTLARYLTISKGQVSLTKEIWKETCGMEEARRSRLQ